MRIVSYNILDGGLDRCDALADIIAAQKPDIVCLAEADVLSVVEKIANRLGMDFIHAPGNSHASALLSRWAIRDTINHALLQPRISKSFLEATVIDPAGKEWTIAVLHLHARAGEADELKREDELDVIMNVFADRREDGRPHLLAGDFNANAPCQKIELHRCKPKTRTEAEANGGYVPRRVVQAMLDAGYRDALLETDRVAAETMGTFTTDFPGQRVDYIFMYGFDRLRLSRAWIVQDEVSRGASDHFPIGLEISA